MSCAYSLSYPANTYSYNLLHLATCHSSLPPPPPPLDNHSYFAAAVALLLAVVQAACARAAAAAYSFAIIPAFNCAVVRSSNLTLHVLVSVAAA